MTPDIISNGENKEKKSETENSENKWFLEMHGENSGKVMLKNGCFSFIEFIREVSRYDFPAKWPEQKQKTKKKNG